MMPKLFIGSSTKGLPIANAIQENLDYDADITIWNQGIFELSAIILSDLEKIVKNFHFAVFVFTPDDVIFSRKKEAVTARDNVIFETGLFIGRLGSAKVYMLKPRNVDLKLPSDLFGVNIGAYNAA
jgi:predicted nucleotide-binding protein